MHVQASTEATRSSEHSVFVFLKSLVCIRISQSMECRSVCSGSRVPAPCLEGPVALCAARRATSRLRLRSERCADLRGARRRLRCGGSGASVETTPWTVCASGNLGSLGRLRDHQVHSTFRVESKLTVASTERSRVNVASALTVENSLELLPRAV